MNQTTNGTLELPEHLINAKKFLKELKEARDVCKKIEDQISWACDFTSFSTITRMLEPVYETVDAAREQIENELYHVDEKIEDYYLKLYEFDAENAIEL